MTAVKVTDPANGALTLNSNGSFTYIPSDNWNGTDTFTYKANDGNTDGNTATVSITVNPINDAPVCNDVDLTTDEDTEGSTEPDCTDVDGDSLAYEISSDPDNGEASVESLSLVYDPSDDFNGTDLFSYTAFDGLDYSYEANVNVTVTSVNDSPVIDIEEGINFFSTDEDNDLTITIDDLLDNIDIYDVEGDTLSISAVSNPVNGSVALVDSEIVFTPTPNYNNDEGGSASFDYIISDGNGGTASSTAYIDVYSVNDAPVATDSSVTTSEDTAVEITLSGTDVDGDSLTYSIVSTVSHGALGDIVGNKVTYTPTLNYYGPASFTFKANDGTIDSDTSTVSITVTAVNDAPILATIGNKTVNELENLSFTVSATDPDNSVTYSLTNAPTGATINSSTGVFSFTPTEAQGSGSYTLTVNATDGTNTDSEEITITVNEINVASVAQDISTSTNEDTVKTITLNATDSDLPANTITYVKVTNPSHGAVSISNDQATYTPTANYNGPDSFTYKANDGAIDSLPATVTITITSVNDSPTAVNDAYTTNEDTIYAISPSSLIANDADVDGDTLTVSAVSNPLHGTVQLEDVNPNGNNVIFTPETNYNGPASFDYTITDGNLTDTATVTITYNPVNDAPVVNDDSISTNQDTPVTITLSGSDVDEDALTYEIVDDPANGTLGIISGDQVTYTPNTSYSGNDFFTFIANDGIVDSNTATINIVINDTNAPTVTKLGDGSTDFTLEAGDTPLTFSEVLSDSSKTAVQNALTAGADKGLNYSWSGETLTITASETTIFANDVVVNVSDVAGNTTNSLLIVDSSLTSTQTTPNSDGEATADSDSPEVVITDPDDEVKVTVDGTTEATIDVSSFITDGTGTIPKITINSDSANVVIPATTVTGPAGWDGVIAAPTVTTITLPEISGETLTTNAAIEIGFIDAKLSFDNAVRILLPGQASKRAGYSRPGTAFTEITSICSSDSQAAGDTLGVDGECKIDSGLDLVIWTKHFTKFAAYTQTTNSISTTSSSSSSSSGGTSNPSAPVCNDQKPGSEPVLLSAIAGINSVILTWAKASDPVSYYLITFGTSPGAQTYGNPNIGNKDTTSYTVSGLSGGVTYYFKVRAGNGCAPGDFSNETSALPTGGFIGGVAPGFAPGVLGVTTETKEKLTLSPTASVKISPTQTGQVKGIAASTQRKLSKLILPIISIILSILLVYIYKRRKKNT